MSLSAEDMTKLASPKMAETAKAKMKERLQDLFVQALQSPEKSLRMKLRGVRGGITNSLHVYRQSQETLYQYFRRYSAANFKAAFEVVMNEFAKEQSDWLFTIEEGNLVIKQRKTT